MSSANTHVNSNRQIRLMTTEMTVVNRTSISGVSHETIQAIKTMDVLGTDTAVQEIAAALTQPNKDGQ